MEIFRTLNFTFEIIFAIIKNSRKLRRFCISNVCFPFKENFPSVPSVLLVRAMLTTKFAKTSTRDDHASVYWDRTCSFCNFRGSLTTRVRRNPLFRVVSRNSQQCQRAHPVTLSGDDKVALNYRFFQRAERGRRPMARTLSVV